jgi:translation initiation factor 1
VGRLFAGTQFDRPPKCDRCGKLEAECECPPPPKTWMAPEKQTARLAVEKRKKGKVVTVIRGLSAEGNDLAALLTLLKNKCGAGGTVEGNEVEIQGEHLERVREILTGLKYKLK